jgi:histidyl-tRNA synthetase
MYPEDTKRPFKRYQVGKVCRAEKPQAGRFREFMQFDADIVGSSSVMADAEIVSLMYETMKALGFERFVIRVNSRKILNGLAEYAGFSAEQTADVLRVIDKLDKQGWESVREELLSLGTDKTEASVGLSQRLSDPLSESSVDLIKRFLEIREGDQEDTLAKVSSLMSGSKIASVGIANLMQLMDNVRALDVPDSAWKIDLSVARGLGYYTGIVFETMLSDLPQIGSVFSGGRYDDLVARFGSTSLPATGASIGVDRLFAAMEVLGLVKRQNTVAKIMILNFDTDSQHYVQYVASLLRRVGVPTEIYLGNEVTLKGQLAFAVRQEYPFVVIAGDRERKSASVQFKDMVARTQREIELSELLATIQNMI